MRRPEDDGASETTNERNRIMPIAVADILAVIQNELQPQTEKLAADSAISHDAVQNVATVQETEQASVDAAVAHQTQSVNAAQASADAAVAQTTQDQADQQATIEKIEAMLEQLKAGT